MEGKGLTGIFFCDSSNGKGTGVDLSILATYISGFADVKECWYLSQFSLSDPKRIVELINDQGLKRIVLAGAVPGFHKPFFSKVMATANLNQDQLFLAAFKEHGAVDANQTDLAKAILACAVLGVPFEAAAVPENSVVNVDTLVIGAGIAGIQASLEIADSGNKVYLVEKSGTIGGHMAMFDKTFPTLDCAACILTPKMVEIGQHANIDLMTYCEVQDVTGEPGNYKVKILKKARRVSLADCIGCGICTEKCPAKAPSEFDADVSLRKAIYIPFPQAVPNKYLIDGDSCIYVEKGKCGVCVKVCPANCIDLDEKDEVVEVTVGNIIVATGFKPFDAKKAEPFGYGKFPNVVTSLEFERLVNAAGPTGGNITLRTQDKRGNWQFSAEGDDPKSIALIHCIGSRDENHNKYCSKVCCMYSLKLAHLVKEKLPDADVYEFYIDMRAFGKGYEEFYERIKEEGINVIRGRTAKIEESNGQLLLRSEDIVNDELIELPVDMVVLSVGLEPRDDAGQVAKMLGLPVSEDGWFAESNGNSDPVGTSVGGVFVAGVCQGPKDIPDSVAQGAAAASRVLQSIVKGTVQKGVSDLTLEKIETRAKEIAQKP